jgi:hypothetical protein
MGCKTGFAALLFFLCAFQAGRADPFEGQAVGDTANPIPIDSVMGPPEIIDSLMEHPVSVDSMIEQPADADSLMNLPAAVDSNVEPAPSVPIDPVRVNFITIEGLVLDSVTGLFPLNDSISVFIDSSSVPIDSEGNFSTTAGRSQQYHLTIYSGGTVVFSSVIPDDPQKPNLFVTCMLSKKKAVSAGAPAKAAAPVEGVPWTISGCIVDSRLDLAITSPLVNLAFDDSTLALSSKGSFTVTTRIPGVHTLHLQALGYHELFETVVLSDRDKQPFVTLATTETKYALKRREITVSAKREPVHATATVASVNISRKELLRSTGTINDPVRSLNTLPGVAAESDLSAVPIVRGGDLQESRVSLDGIPMLQPFHFGGIKSMFNTLGVENLTLYKSGFPSQYHNAQSGLIVAETRSPARDSLVVSGDINLLQYCTYLGIPLMNHTMGLSLASQGSYFDFMTKRMMDFVIWSSKDEYQKEYLKKVKQQMNQPDYQDYSAGFEWRPGDKFNISISDLYNTDRMWYTYGDSVTPVNCLYQNKLYFYDPGGSLHLCEGPTGNPSVDTLLRDTSFTYLYMRRRWNDQFPPFNVRPDSVWEGRSYYEIDTALHYKSGYNFLYTKAQYLKSADQIFTFSAAWQKRWWDLMFPEGPSGLIDTSKYDVTLDQWNAHAGMLYSGKNGHLLRCGLQWDLTAARYDVFTFRMFHEFISKASTNFGDYWGPVTNDTGLTIAEGGEENGGDDAVGDMIGRLLVSYTGSRLFNNGSIYGEDEWTPTPRLTLNYGGRIEISQSDTSVMFSPRLSLKYQWRPDHEFIAASGLYTQNNYDIASLALSEDLKPEKVWHASVGMESKLLPWLTQKVDLYGKYYVDLTSEEIEPVREINADMLARADDYISSQYGIRDIDSLKTHAPEEYANMVMAYLLQYEMYASRFSNEGRGWAAGGEYFLRYDPADFWDGWISFTLGRSMRQRHPGWRWHDFPLERPLLISLVNYYRLPRKFELGIKYRFMSGIPYTPATFRDGITIGAYNSRRYSPYQSLDLKIARGFRVRGAKAHFYIEAWNMLNAPNMMLSDSKTHRLQMIGMNLPFTVLFVGLDINTF